MKPKKDNPLKWAAWGFFIGGLLVAYRSGADPGVEQIASFIGGAIGGAFFMGIVAFIRNLFIR